MTIKNKKQIAITLAVFLLLLLANCTAQNESQPLNLPDPTQTVVVTTTAIPIDPTPELVKIPGYEEITPDNFDKLYVIKKLGDGKIADVAVSPNNDVFAVYTVKGIYIYDIDTFTEIAYLDFDRFRIYMGELNSTNTLSFSPDGFEIIFSTRTSIRSWNYVEDTTKGIAVSEIPGWVVSNVEYSPDGNRILITTEGTMNGYETGYGINFAIYSLNNDLLYNHYFLNGEAESFYHFTDDGKVVFLQTYLVYDVAPELYPFEVVVVDLNTGFPLVTSHKEKDNFDEPFYEVINGNPAYLPSKQLMDLWREQYHESLKTGNENIECYGFDPYMNAHYSIISKQDNIALVESLENVKILSIEQWDINECKKLRNLPIAYADNYRISNNGKYLISNNYYSINIWNLETMSIRFSVINNFSQDDINYTISSDDNRLITSSIDYDSEQELHRNIITVWDMETGKDINQFYPNHHAYYLLRTSNPDIIISRGKSFGIELWNITNGELIKTLPYGNFIIDKYRDGIWILEEKNQEESINVFCFYDISSGKKIFETLEIQGEIFNSSLQSNGKVIEFHLTNAEFRDEIYLIDINENNMYLKSVYTNSYVSLPVFDDQQLHYAYYGSDYYYGDNLIIINNANFAISKKINENILWNTFFGYPNDIEKSDSWIITNQRTVTSNFVFALQENGLIRVYGIPENPDMLFQGY